MSRHNPRLLLLLLLLRLPLQRLHA